MQAAAAQVPIVATAVDGTPEVVSDGVTGLLAEPGEHQQIAAQILRLVHSPGLRQELIRAAAEQGRTGSFEIAQMLAELEAAYDRLLAQTRC
jgi:glycosyltransferase involved in cell wall biosynthesis